MTLSRNRDFVRLWTGETISLFGSEITELALPLAAILLLNAGPSELGLLAAVRFAPFLLLTLPAGVAADRFRRRPLLVAANLGRAIAIGSVPALALAGALSFPALLAASFAVGTLTVIFDVSYVSYVPSVVGRDQLVQANSRLQTSASVAAIGGPGLGGLLVQALSAPVALVVDAISYLVSAVNLLLIRTVERKPRVEDAHGVLHAVTDGFSMLWRHRSLRSLAFVAGIYNLFGEWFTVLFVLFALEELGLSATTIGLVLSSGAVGALLGSLLASRAADRLGIGRALVLAVAIECIAMLPTGLLAGPDVFVLAALFGVFVVNGCFVTMSSVHALAYRQAVTPEQLLGRVTSAYRLISYGAIPLGAVLGGLAGETLGARAGLVLGSACLLSAVVAVVASPLRSVRELPTLPEIEPGGRRLELDGEG